MGHTPATGAQALLSATNSHSSQLAFPVLDVNEKLIGVIYSEDLAVVRAEPDLEGVIRACDIMRPPVFVQSDEDLHAAFELMRGEGVHEVPVLDPAGRVIGSIDEASIVAAFLRASSPKTRQVPLR